MSPGERLGSPLVGFCIPVCDFAEPVLIWHLNTRAKTSCVQIMNPYGLKYSSLRCVCTSPERLTSHICKRLMMLIDCPKQPKQPCFVYVFDYGAQRSGIFLPNFKLRFLILIGALVCKGRFSDLCELVSDISNI